MGREVVAAGTKGRLDSSTEAPPEPAEVSGTWERVF